MNKFKKGDRVVCTEKNNWVTVGMIGTVSEDSLSPFVQWDNGKTWSLKEEDMELMNASRTQQIHITTKDTTTIAVLTDGKKEIRRAVAKCSSSDKFDFEVGAKLAFDRLIGAEEKKEETVPPALFDWDLFKQGKIVVNCDTEAKASKFLNECDVQGIKWSSGHKASEQNYGVKCYRCFGTTKALVFDNVENCKCDGVTITDYPFTSQVKEVKIDLFSVSDAELIAELQRRLKK